MHVITQWRKKNNLTAAEIARLGGVSAACISLIETGVNRVSGDLAVRLSQLTGICIYELRPDLKVSVSEKKRLEKHLQLKQEVQKLRL